MKGKIVESTGSFGYFNLEKIDLSFYIHPQKCLSLMTNDMYDLSLFSKARFCTYDQRDCENVVVRQYLYVFFRHWYSVSSHSLLSPFQETVICCYSLTSLPVKLIERWHSLCVERKTKLQLRLAWQLSCHLHIFYTSWVACYPSLAFLQVNTKVH